MNRFSLLTPKHAVIAVMSLAVPLLCQSAASGALLWNFQARDWDNGRNHIIRDNNFLTGKIPAVLPNFINNYSYWMIEEKADGSQAFSGSAAAYPVLTQNVFADNPSDKKMKYEVRNYVENTFQYRINEDSYGLSRGQDITEYSSFILDGFMTLRKDAGDANLKGTKAVFTVEIAAQGLNWPYEQAKKLFKGKITLTGKKNGKVKLKVSGDLKKNMITAIE